MPRPKEYVVTLTAGDRVLLARVVSRGTHPARMIARARVLLELDESGGAASDRRVVAERVGVSEGTVYRVAKRFAEVGGDVEAAIGRRKRATPPVPAKVTGDVEARVIALACTAPPAGYERWSLRLLERQVVLTDGIPPLDHSTIGRVLKRGASPALEAVLDDPAGRERRVRGPHGGRPGRLPPALRPGGADHLYG